MREFMNINVGTMSVSLIHADHGVSEDHVRFMVAQLSDHEGFFIRTVELPSELPDLWSGLHGPLAGDQPVPESEVVWSPRGDRGNLSRLCDREMRPTRLLTAIGVKDASGIRFFTAYGGPCAPREIGDPSLEGDEVSKRESAEFWAVHALSPSV